MSGISHEKVKNRILVGRFFIIAGLVFGSVSPGHAEEVSKEIWVNTMKTALPNAFCQKLEFFRECFDVNEDQCIEAAALATRICLHKYINQIPDTLIQPKDGAKWGNVIGQCAGENFHQTLGRLFKNTKECNNMDFWN